MKKKLSLCPKEIVYNIYKNNHCKYIEDMKHRNLVIRITFFFLLFISNSVANSQCLQSIHTKLKEEIDQSDSLICWAKKHFLYRDTRIRINSSGNDKPSKLPVESAAPYTLSPIKDLEGIEKNFNLHANLLELVQRQKDGLSELDINISQETKSSALDDFHRNYSPTHQILTIYHNGQPVSLNDLGVAKADSVMVQTTMHLPLSMKTLTIQNEDTTMVYGSDSVDYFWIDKDEFEINFPVSLYPKVLSFQAIDKQGRYMDANSKSSFPLFVISEEVLCCLREMKDIRTKCLTMDHEDAIKALLSSFTPLQKNTERDIKQIYQLYLDKNIDAILEKYMNKPLWSIKAMRVWAAYPRFVEKIVLYMTDREEQFESENFVYPQNEEKYHIASWTGEDDLSEKKKFSLVDDEGRKLVTFPDNLLMLVDNGGNYYEGITEGTIYTYSYYSYWLNEKKQQIEKLPFRFIHQFNDVSVVGTTEGENGSRYGVYSNDHLHKELLAPNYDDMWKLGTHLIAINDKEKKTDFYDSDLQKLEGMNFQAITQGKFGFETDYMLVSDTYSGMKGMLNKQLKLSVPCIYTYIKEFEEDRFYVTNQAKLRGVIDSNNGVILPLEYDFIIYNNEEGSLSAFGKSEKTGYMNRKYEEVIPAQFDEGHEFVKGYAMVIQGNTYGIINAKGEYVMKENFTSEDRRCNYGFPNLGVVYKIDGKRYNYKGERLK